MSPQRRGLSGTRSRGRVRGAVLAPRGRLDLATAPAFREHVTQLVDSGVAHIVVDLGTVSFVDSSGLGALISGLKRAGIELNRKVLADIAVNDAAGFATLVEKAKAAHQAHVQ